MKKSRIDNTIAILFGLGLFILLFIGAFRFMLFNKAFFEWHYTAHGVVETTQTSLEELMRITGRLLDYIKGRMPALDMEAVVAGSTREVFNEREKAHMVDVKALYDDVLRLQWGGFMAAFWAFVAASRRGSVADMLKKLKWIFLSAGSAAAVLAGLFALDFERWFTFFHEVFFSNDLWLLDPRTDLMINMVPEIYFYQIVAFSSLLFLGAIVLLAAAGHWAGSRLERRSP